ncbi:Alpha/beta hydrolase fold-3 [Niveomyces insectorum RCEF 264]|uniref:Alpha/beta hydrolase fold-3 n=1 Tax=Niveomyces insectorum RCEF 264 TaxID=1081102 RepID=A0A167T410_9HYPO|nr:Alpha/beta hydrolase fold-3 [Niveomyces insectorum RCEF 264]
MSMNGAINPIKDQMRLRLDRRFVKFYDEHMAARLETHQVSLSEARKHPQKFARPWPHRPTPPPADRMRDWTVIPDEVDAAPSDSLPFAVRTYHPDPAVFGPGPYPVHVRFHGGGWVFGGLGADAPICIRLQQRLGIVIVDVDYHLCPEAEFGQNVKDAWVALLWTRQNATMLNVDNSSVSIGGISAGGHLACVLQHMARDAHIPLKLLLVTVPVTADHDKYLEAKDSPFPSFSEFSEAPTLNFARMRYFSSLVFPPHRLGDLHAAVPAWWISPLRAPNFTGLCDTVILTAECDPLRDEGEAYGAKLVAAGNKVLSRRQHNGMRTTSKR